MPSRPVVRAVAVALLIVAAGFLIVPTSALVGSQRGSINCGIPGPAAVGVTPRFAQSDDELVTLAYGTSAREIARFGGSAAGQALESIGRAAGHQLARAVREEAAEACAEKAVDRGITAGILAVGALGLVLLDLRRAGRADEDEEPGPPEEGEPVVTAP